MEEKYLIWGTGRFSDVFFDVFHTYIAIEGFVETEKSKETFKGLKVYEPNELSNVTWSAILIINTHGKEIYRLCEQIGLDKKKVVDVFLNRIGINICNDKIEFHFLNGDNCKKWITWNGFLFCTNEHEIFNKIVKNNNFSKWWKTVGSNVLLNESDQLQNRSIEFIDNNVLPLIDKNACILDIGCSNGFFCEYLSKYCRHIDAFDYSPKAIESAINNAKIKGINNIKYYVDDAKKFMVSKKYDMISMLGIGMYFEEDSDFGNLLRKVDEMLLPGGIVLVKDSLNTVCDESIYHCNFEVDYQGCYRAINRYEEFWSSMGYSIESKVILADDLNIGSITKLSMGYLLRKK